MLHKFKMFCLIFLLLDSGINYGTTTTVAIYMAARNDLNVFAARNISQMQAVGSNNNLKIVVQLDTYTRNKKTVTKRLLVEKNKTVQIGPDLNQDSGNPESLISFFKWVTQKYPADEYVVMPWNHGTGSVCPKIKRAINPSQLFKYNFKTNLIELNRSVSFLDHINEINAKNDKTLKAICFDDANESYLSNRDLTYAIKTISQDILNNKKITVCCDACLMSGIEVIYPLRNYVKYFIGSQEVVLGTGYDYSFLLRPLLANNYNINNFPKHVVNSFRDSYKNITNDYTQSAIDTNHITNFAKNIEELAELLSWGIKHQKNQKVRDLIKISRHKNYCTHFDEVSYIDIGHFYKNLLTNLKVADLQKPSDTLKFKSKLTALTEQILNPNGLIKKTVIENVVGKNLKNATGLYIYFPERFIDESYKISEFAINTGWLNFLKLYLNLTK